MTEAGSASVIIPFQPDGMHRDWVLDYVVRRWTEAGYDPIIGQPFPGEPWCKARAIDIVLNDSDADVLVIADADVWCDPTAVLNAITMTQVGGFSWAMPHGTVFRLDEASTAAVLAGKPIGGRTERAPYRGVPGGGLIVIRREFYEQAPFDHRFIGWGHEDQSAGLAWEALGGAPWRGAAKLWHLWHPPAPRLTPGVGSPESKALVARYIQAANNEDQMRQIVAEARGEVST